jgi:hypothetical protein
MFENNRGFWKLAKHLYIDDCVQDMLEDMLEIVP